ncbi:hypothetical protein EDB89DRAFT_2074692 [Lactarius sanguifluus]|nr:hypothetical protein EDB89DRAFT_2074692 [Lactarius sanguifluus]
MPGKSPNASPDTPYHTFDSHSILSQFESPSYLQGALVPPPRDPELRPALHFQHGVVSSPQVSGNELGIYEAPPNPEPSLSPLDAFDETTEPLATHVPEEPLHGESSRHVRSPILSKQPTRLEGLSRTVRNYVPTPMSIAVPSASPSPPRVALPVSFGTDHRRSWGTEAGGKTLDEVLALDQNQTNQGGAQRSDLPRYPGSDDSEHITWARWDTLRLAGAGSPKRLLVLGYLSGLQIWDCTNLDSITEMLNVSGPEWGSVWNAQVLPGPLPTTDDQFLSSRPLLGLIAKRPHQGPDFLVYSLLTHKIIKKFSIPGILSFSANSNVIIISTSNPSSLRVLSSCTFTSLSIISSGLSTFTHPQSSSTTPTNPDTTVLPSNDIDINTVSTVPRPVFALSHRFLAYASRSPSVGSGRPYAQTPVRADGAGMQPDLGVMALRVGGSVLSGMRALGGRALTAARARISDTPSAPPSKPLSRSAPEQESTPNESSSQPAQTGHHVTILDLAPLAAPSPRAPELIVEFLASKRQPISALHFSTDGSALMVVPSDGQTIRVFQVRPAPHALRSAISEAGQFDGAESAPTVPVGSVGSLLDALIPTPKKDSAPWHMYDLRRGRTSAIVENLDWASDGRWIAVATRKRTVHVFAANPYGGLPDGHSHIKGRSLSTSLPPLVRLRATQPAAGRPTAPLAFIFIHSNAHSLPKRLLPSPGVVSPPCSTPSSSHSSPPQEPLSPPHRCRRSNFQDILMFDPADGSLSLRRCEITLRPYEQNLSVPSAVPGIGGTSISLPSRPSFGRVSAPLPAPATTSRNKPTVAQAQDKPTEMVGYESEVATWNLRRGRDWPMVRAPVRVEGHVSETFSSASAPNWLSFAELRTSSQSPLVLPQSLYLSHQFSFHALGDDYHGRLRRFQLDALGPKIEVRKEVEISAYAAGAGEAFIHGSHETGRASSSFDEPLSSAMASGLEYPSSPPVIPMFPNGTPGSFKNSVPIQRVAAGLSDGMSEGFARVRRGVSRVRSPRLIAHNDMATGVPLEFGEEDEDFMLSAYEGTSNSRDDGGSVSVSTPSSGPIDAGEHKDDENTWSLWDAGTSKVDEEQELSVVGLMDEEQALTKRRSRSLAR